MKVAPVCVQNKTNGQIVCEQTVVAKTFRARLQGLRGKRSLGAGEGLLIEPTSAVHTMGMKFAMDAIALDRNLRVVGLRAGMKCDRFAIFSWKTHCVLEVPAGQIERANIQIGDQLLLSAAHVFPASD